MGIEPTTPCLQSRCSSQLSYSPEKRRAYRLPATTSSASTQRIADVRPCPLPAGECTL